MSLFHEEEESELEGEIERAANRYADGIMRGGLRRSERLERALAARAVETARANHQARADRTLRRNIGGILSDYEKRDREIRREGARMAWVVCPFAVLAFSFLAWFKYHQGDPGTGLICGAGALAFLVMLVLAQWRARR